MSDLRNRSLLLALVLAAASGCSALPWVAPEPAPLVSATPVTDPTEVASVETAAGTWFLVTYRGDERPCVDLVAPDGSRQPRCPIPDPSGGQDGWVIVEATRPPADGDGLWVVNGFARSEVRSIVFHPEDAEPIEIHPREVDGGGSAVFLAVLPGSQGRFDVSAYDARGCLLQRDRHDLQPSPGEPPFTPGAGLEEPDCSEGVRRAPSTTGPDR